MINWTNESDFVEAFLMSSIRNNMNQRYNLRVCREVRTGYGRPDVVIIEFKPEIVKARSITRNIKPLTTNAAYAISYLSSRSWVTETTLRLFLNCSKPQFNSVLEELDIRGILIHKEHLIKTRPKSEILAVHRLWVYEAKLYQWKEAITQAERHLWFTKDSFVLLPAERAGLLPTISTECDRRGVGLSTYSEDYGFQTVVHPAKTGVTNSPFLWTINENLIGGDV